MVYFRSAYKFQPIKCDPFNSGMTTYNHFMSWLRGHNSNEYCGFYYCYDEVFELVLCNKMWLIHISEIDSKRKFWTGIGKYYLFTIHSMLFDCNLCKINNKVN